MPNSIKTAVSVLVAIMAVIACVENDRTLGQQFVSSDYILKVDSVMIKLPMCQKVHDTVQGEAYSRMMVGYIADTTYGVTDVQTFSFVVPVSDSAYLGINPRFVNAYLDLVIDSSFCYTWGNDAIPQNIYLYEVVKDILGDSSKVYNNSITPDCLSKEPISLGSPMIFGPSTVRIGLTKEYGENLLATSPSEFKNARLFCNRVHGIYMKSDVPDVSGGIIQGGRMNSVSLSSSFITVEYIMNDPEQNIVDKDTTVSFVYGYGYALNQFSAGSRSREIASRQRGDVLYMDGLSGVKPVISGQELKIRLDRWVDDVCREEECEKESILLSRARLIFPYSMPDDHQMFEYEHPLKIFPFWTNVTALDSTVMMWPLDDISRASGGSMDRSHEYYYCDVTYTMQEMISEDLEEISSLHDMWICPVRVITNSSTYATTYTFDVEDYKRVILKGAESDDSPRLELVYGILKDW